MNNGDPFGQEPYTPEQPMPGRKRKSPRRFRIASIALGVLVIVGIYAQEIIRELVVKGGVNAVSTVVRSGIPTATSLAQGPAVRPGGADTEDLAAAILSDDRMKSVRVLFNAGQELTRGQGDWLIIDIMLKDSCNTVTVSPSCMPLVNDLGGLIFLKYPTARQLGGMAIIIDGVPQFSAPLDVWEQLVTTPHP